VFVPVSFLGFYLAPMFVYVCWTIPVFLVVYFVLQRCGVFGFVWNVPLFNVSIYLILLALIALGF
jgi:hypothetical protein